MAIFSPHLVLLLLHSCACLIPGPWLEGPEHGEVGGFNYTLENKPHFLLLKHPKVHYYFDRHFGLLHNPYSVPKFGHSLRHGHHVSNSYHGVTSGSHFQDSYLQHSPGRRVLMVRIDFQLVNMTLVKIRVNWDGIK